MNIEEIVARARVIPVLEFTGEAQAAPLARALEAGGLKVIEMTMRTPEACRLLVAMKTAAPSLLVGMGTIRSKSDIEKALASGADFLVSPGSTPELLRAIKASVAPALPGVATASEAMAAREAGFNVLKFFPAEPSGGVAYLKALAGPLPDISFCPTGSISAEKAPAYLALPNVKCVGGSWIASRAMIEAGEWNVIEENARRAASL